MAITEVVAASKLELLLLSLLWCCVTLIDRKFQLSLVIAHSLTLDVSIRPDVLARPRMVQQNVLVKQHENERNNPRARSPDEHGRCWRLHTAPHAPLGAGPLVKIAGPGRLEEG